MAAGWCRHLSHAFASFLIDAGISKVRAIREYMGHSSGRRRPSSQAEYPGWQWTIQVHLSRVTGRRGASSGESGKDGEAGIVFDRPGVSERKVKTDER